MRLITIFLFLSSLTLAGCGGEDATSSAVSAVSAVKSGPVIAAAVNAVP